MKTLRQLIVESLIEDAVNDRCEWSSSLLSWTDDGQRVIPEGLPMKGNFIDYALITPAFINAQSDEMLLSLYTANCCLAFR